MSIARKIGNLGTALDSAALSTFLSKGTTDGEFDTIAWGDVTGKPSYIDSALATQLFDSAYIQLRQSAVSSGGLDSAAVTTLIDSSYVANRAGTGSSGFIMYNYNATSGQTAFQDSDTAGNVLSYTADGILVYYNGLLLADEDYTATDGSAVTLTEGADSGAQITIGKWNLTGSGSSSGSGAVAGPWGDRALAHINGTSNLDYFDIATLGNGTNFGTLTTTSNAGSGFSDGTYGLFTIGYDDGVSTRVTTIDYVTIATTSNASDFGDLTEAKNAGAATASETYGLVTGGLNNSFSTLNTIEYVTIATPGNASDFGDMTAAGRQHDAVSDGTYGVIGGRNTDNITMDYVTIATPSNASDFGDMIDIGVNYGGCADPTYGVFGGGGEAGKNTIQYITIATPGNGTDFGDLSVARQELNGTSNGARGCFVGGQDLGTYLNTIDYITIASPGNATDFGDLSTTSIIHSTCSGSPS